MRHHNVNKKFGLESKERAALMHALLISLIAHKKIVTTEARTKALRPRIERLVTLARVTTLARTRLLNTRLHHNKKAVHTLVKDIAPKYKERAGGYTRITKLGQRQGDASPLAQIEFI